MNADSNGPRGRYKHITLTTNGGWVGKLVTKNILYTSLRLPREFLRSRRKYTIYRQIYNIRRILIGDTIDDHSDEVGASPVGAAPTTSSFSTWHLTTIDCTKTSARRDEIHSIFLWFGAAYIWDFIVYEITYGQRELGWNMFLCQY